MGLLSLGTPLPWSEAQQHADHVRKHGIVQFLNIWNRIKRRRRDHLLWGDEVGVCMSDGDIVAWGSVRNVVFPAHYDGLWKC